MSAFATLTLQNNAAANVVFNPSSISDGVASWFNSTSVYDARQKVTLSVKLPKSGSQVARVVGRVTLPIMDSVDTTKKIGEAYANVEFVLPKQMSETQRLDLRKEMDTLIQNAVFTAAIQYLESIY